MQLEIATPPFRSSAYGLLSVASVSDDVNQRSLNGGTFLSMAAGTGTGAVIDGTGAGACDPLGNADEPKVANIDDDWRDAVALVLYGWWECSPVGYTPTEAANAARTPFLAGESRTLEALLWDVWAADCDTASPATLIQALANAEEAIADDYGGEGVIHMSRSTATLLGYGNLTRVGSALRTVNYTPVVVGDGYDSGVVLATGPISIVRGPLMDLTPDYAGFDRSRNDLAAVIERSYLVAADGPASCYALA